MHHKVISQPHPLNRGYIHPVHHDLILEAVLHLPKGLWEPGEDPALLKLFHTTLGCFSIQLPLSLSFHGWCGHEGLPVALQVKATSWLFRLTQLWLYFNLGFKNVLSPLAGQRSDSIRKLFPPSNRNSPHPFLCSPLTQHPSMRACVSCSKPKFPDLLNEKQWCRRVNGITWEGPHFHISAHEDTGPHMGFMPATHLWETD